jgi:hypothetical protein
MHYKISASARRSQRITLHSLTNTTKDITRSELAVLPSYIFKRYSIIGSLVFIFITSRAIHALLPSTYSSTPTRNTENAFHCVKYDVQCKNVSSTSARNSQGTKIIYSFIHSFTHSSIQLRANIMFHLLPVCYPKLKIKIYRIMILPVFFVWV